MNDNQAVSSNSGGGAKHLVGLLIAMTVLTLRGFAISLLWNWFVAPLGVATIGTITGIGMVFAFRLLSINPSNSVIALIDRVGPHAASRMSMRTGIEYVLASLLFIAVGGILQIFV